MAEKCNCFASDICAPHVQKNDEECRMFHRRFMGITKDVMRQMGINRAAVVLVADGIEIKTYVIKEGE